MNGFRWWFLSAALAALAAACSGSSNAPPRASRTLPTPREVPDPTNARPVLNVYNWSEFIDPDVVAGFEREYGIKVHYDVYESNEMMEVKLLAGHTNYDVVVPGGSFFAREIKAGVYEKLDRSQLPNLKNLDPDAALASAVYDPGNQYGVDYMWLVTVGLGFDADKIKARGVVRTDGWGILFDPRSVAALQDCGVTVLDSPDDVVGAALAYLGKDPNSESPEDLRSAQDALRAIRPYLRYIDSSRYVADLANGEICLALGWSGDVALARRRASEAGKPVNIGYLIPREGSLSIVDVLAIPADAPHSANAHLFINYLLRPDVAARNSAATGYASGVARAAPPASDTPRQDPAVYPPREWRARLVPMRERSAESTRELMRLWTRFKTGQ